MPAVLPEMAVEDKSDFGALASQSSILTPPASSSTFVQPKPPEAIGRIQSSISALMPDYEAKRKAVEEAEKAAIVKRQTIIPPAISKVKESAGAPMPLPPAESPEPPVPDTSPRAFLGGEGKNALQQIVAGLGLLVAAAAGAKRAPAQALGALTGAMTGWAEGDAERASRDWHHYEGLVAKMNRENQRATKAWERAMVIRGGNQQDAKLFLEGSLAEAGMTDLAAEYATKDFARVGTELTTAQALLGKLDTEYNNTVRNALDQWKAGESQRHNQAIEAAQTEKATHADAVLDQLKKYQGEIVEIKKHGPTAQVEKQRLKVAEGVEKLTEKMRFVDESLKMVDDLEAAVKLLDAKGIIPKGGTYIDEGKAHLALQTSVGDEDVADALQTLKRFGTSAVIKKELDIMGGKGASILRLKMIGEAEAGKVLSNPKLWWDRFFADSRRILNGTKAMNAPVLKAYQETLGHLGPSVPDTLPTAPPVDVLNELGFEPEP